MSLSGSVQIACMIHHIGIGPAELNKNTKTSTSSKSLEAIPIPTRSYHINLSQTYVPWFDSLGLTVSHGRT